MGEGSFVPLAAALDALCSACGVDDTIKEDCEYRKDCSEYNKVLRSAFLIARPEEENTTGADR